jgi:hypothetical protein
MIVMRLWHFILVLIIVALVSAPLSSAFAQDKSSGGKKAAGKKSTTIDFEDQLVEGTAAKPELFYLLQKKQFNNKRLIRLRDDFLPEMRKTSEDVVRKGSGN